MGARATAVALIMGAAVVASGSPAHADTLSPEDRYKQAVAHTARMQVQAHMKYRVQVTPAYRDALKVSRSVRKAPPSPKWEPPKVSRQSTDTSVTEPPAPRAGDSADTAWVMGVLATYGLATHGTTWTVDSSGSCAHLRSGKWAGCTTMSTPASVKIAGNQVGTDYGVFVVVHEWAHAVERQSNECAADARARQITGLNYHPYNC